MDHFNRPYDRGRKEAVVIFADRAFELLLKAIIVERGGSILDKQSGHSIGFGKCVQKCLSDKTLICLQQNEALTIQMINALRDAAQHHILDLSEQHLYIHCQSALTLFRKLVRAEFGADPLSWLSERTLPVSTRPPMEFSAVVEATIEDVKALARPGRRQRVAALAKLRSLLALERTIAGRFEQPNEKELARSLRELLQSDNWSEVFPGVASLFLDRSVDGMALHLRISKKEGTAIHLVHDGAPEALVVAVKRVNELDYYNMGLTQVAEKIGKNQPWTLALCKELGIQNDEECFKEIRIGSQTYKRYSQRAVERIKAAIPNLNLPDVWSRNKPRRRRGGARRSITGETS